MFDDLLVKTVSCRLSFLCGSLSKLPKHMTDSSIFRFLLFDTVRSISGCFSPVTTTSSLETLCFWYSKVFINVVKVWIFLHLLGENFERVPTWQNKNENKIERKRWATWWTYLLNYYVFNFAELDERQKKEKFWENEASNFEVQKKKLMTSFTLSKCDYTV